MVHASGKMLPRFTAEMRCVMNDKADGGKHDVHF